MRILIFVRPDILERCVPLAEHYDVHMGVEVHAPWYLDHAWILRTIDVADRLGTRHLGILPDMGIFMKHDPPAFRARFAFEAKLGYYRGLGLSMIEELNVSIDGEAVAREAVTFDEGKGPITLDAMETAYDRRWPFGTPATIAVARPGGFPAGEHRLTFQQKLRISYLPFPSFNTDDKVACL